MSSNKRRLVEQLPVVLQTDTNRKFFAATVDHLFQPGTAETLSGYIGQRPSYFDASKDFYVVEKSLERQAYQLEATMVSTDDTGAVTRALTYDDLIGYLRAAGVDVSDHQRLFETEYYAWAPPVDLDKLLNYRQYLWFGDSEGRGALPTLSIVAPFTAFIGNGTRVRFPLPPTIPGLSVDVETVVGTVDRVSVDAVRDGDDIVFSTAPVAGSLVLVFRYGDLTRLIEGHTTFTTTGFDFTGVITRHVGDGTAIRFAAPAPLPGLPVTAALIVDGVAVDAFIEGDEVVALTPPTPGATVLVMRHAILLPLVRNSSFVTGGTAAALSSGMRVRLIDGYGLTFGWDDSGWDTTAFDAVDADISRGDRSYFIEGVGRGIRLVPTMDMVWGVAPQHVTVDRSSVDANPWSMRNHWVHKDTIAWSERSFIERQARRPIIEFERDLWLHNYGFRRLPEVDLMLTDPRGVIRYDDYDEGGFDLSGFDEPTVEYIAVENLNGSPIESLFVAPGMPLTPGTRLLVAQQTSTAPVLNNRIYKVEIDGDARLVVLVPEADLVLEGSVVAVRSVDGEFWFDGTAWRAAQSWAANGAPLFRLTDLSGTPLDDATVYPGSNFAGSRIFGFAPGSSVDTVLGQSIRRDARGRIMFEADATTRRATWQNGEIGGLYFHVFRGGDDDARLGTTWRPASQTTTQTPGEDNISPVPTNLQANPDNEEVTFLTRGDFFDHFRATIGRQQGLIGEPYAANNYRDTARDLSLGNRILQHRSPLLKTMLLVADDNFDLPSALRFAEQEYARFRSKFIVRTDELLRRGFLTDDMTMSAVVSAVLDSLQAEKSSDFPFALSPLGGGQFFIPPTPASIGVAPCWQPTSVSIGGADYIRGHDGSLTPMFGDYRDGVMLALEERIWENLPQEFRSDEGGPAFDIERWTGGRFNEEPLNGYFSGEFKRQLSAPFEMWCQLNRVDYKSNKTYITNDPWTWNYRDAADVFGKSIPFGHWRGIYRFFYDTDQPDAEPWAMLGFKAKPSWWDSEYGAAPYTRGNTKLWSDLELGLIRGGARAGTDARYARPGLSLVIPVDDGGELVDPVAAGIVRRPPDVSAASRPWVFGDFGPMEALWATSPSAAFHAAIAAFLLKPARFVEQGWATVSNGYAGDQWLDFSLGRRPRHASLSVHGENNQAVIGIQQWVVDYLIHRGQSASVLGDAVRGLGVRLAHKMAGFTTTDGLRVTADNSGLLPAEDVSVALYRSPIIRKESYSGVVVEWTGRGWRVIGYDARDPAFKIIPADENGPRGVITVSDTPEPVINEWRPNTFFAVNVVVAHNNSIYRCARSHTSGTDFEPIYWTAEPGAGRRAPRVIRYLRGNGELERIPYGTEFYTQQEVADFLLGHERYLVSRGWVFDVVDQESQETRNWSNAVREFLAWSQINWAQGAFIALSPGAEELRFTTPTGTITNVETQQDGFFGLVDRSSAPIDRRDSLVTRIDGDITMRGRASTIFGARLGVADYEHIMLFSNTTIFDDVIYAPLFNIRQPRLRVLGKRTTGWNGRLDAPGFVLVDGEIVPNFEKAADDIRYAFDIEKADRVDLRDHARHLIGYQSRDYLANLLLSETEQFEFFQGMIQQKGTSGVFERLLRSQRITDNRDLRFLEEWAIRVGRFGGRPGPRAAFLLREDDTRREPQIVRLGTTTPGAPAEWIEMPSGDTRWVERPQGGYSIFPLQQQAPSDALPTAGYVRLGETSHTAVTVDDIVAIYVAGTTTFPEGERVWVYNYGPQRSWTVLRSDTLGTAASLLSPDDDDTVIGLRVVLTAPHGLTDNEIGSMVILEGEAFTDLSGVYAVTEVGSDWIEIGAVASSQTITAPDNLDVRIFRPIRFSSHSALLASATTFTDGELAYVDVAEDGSGWAVVARSGTQWQTHRREPRRVDPRAVAGAMIYDQRTRIGSTRLIPTPPLLDRINIIDPISGLIAGTAERELSYKIDNDPARYSASPYGGGDEWCADKVGVLWWDLSTVRFLDPMTDVLDAEPARTVAELDYRSRYWSRLAPGVSVDIYEWTASSVPPAEFDGTVLGAENARYVEKRAFDPIVGRESTTYYFWVLNPQIVPAIPGRSISARAVASLIENPLSLDLPWVAPIAPDTLLVGGMSAYLNDESTVLKVDLLPPSDVAVHDEWTLLRPNDQRSLPPAWLWDKLRDSLTGFDERLRPVPDPGLNPLRRTGILPGQGMFAVDNVDGPRRGLLEARESFVGIVNAILARTSVTTERPAGVAALRRATPLTEHLIWVQADGDFYVEPCPPSTEYDVQVYTPSERDALLRDPEFLADLLDGKRWRVLVDGLARTTPQWSVWEADASIAQTLYDAADPAAIEDAADLIFRLATSYDHEVSSIAERDALISTLNADERVLVRADDRWTIWRFTGTTFVLSRAEVFRTEDFVSEVNWYAPDYSPSSPPVVRYVDARARNAAEGAIPTTTFVRVDDDGSGRWAWTSFSETTQSLVFIHDGATPAFDIGVATPTRLSVAVSGRTLAASEFSLSDFTVTILVPVAVGARVTITVTQGFWTTVARERGTLALSPNFFVPTRERVGLTGNWSNRDGSWEMRAVVDALRSGGLLTDLELNETFFSILHFIHSQQDDVDWAFKTSMMSVAGYNELLEQTPVTATDNTDSLLAYLDEVKPYRVKTRDFLRALATPTDMVQVRVTEPERKTKFMIAFDRISVTGQLPNWDVGAFDDYAWDTGEPGLSQSAADRIDAFYSPKTGMREKSIPDLMKARFRGTTIDGGGLSPEPIYDIAYDGNAGPNDPQINGDRADGSPGLRIVDAIRSGKPEERIELTHDDGLVMVIRARGTPGAPWHESMARNVSDTHDLGVASVRVGAVAQTAHAVAVYRDGVRGFEGTHYTVDHIGGAVTVATPGVNRVMVHAIGPSGTVTNRYFFQYRGGAASFTLDEEAVKANLDVVVAGQRLPDSAYTLSGGVTLALTTAPAVGSDVVITAYQSSVATSASLARVDVLDHNPDQTWTLVNRDEETFPEHAGTVVEADGLRLTPPPTYYGTLSATKFWIDTNFEPDFLTRIDIWVNGERDTRPVLRSPFQTAQEVRAAIDASNGTSAFGVLGETIVAGSEVPTDAEVVVAVHERHDYYVDNGVLKVVTSLPSSARLHVTTFSNGASVMPRVHVFQGSLGGVYALDFPKDPSHVWVTVDGRRLSSEEFELTDATFGFDEETWDEAGFDVSTPRRVLRIYGSQAEPGPAPDATVVVQTFMADAAREPISWRVATGSRASVRMVPIYPSFPVDPEDWQANTTYDLGSIVDKDRKVYVCAVPHTSGADFDEAFWTIIAAKPSDLPNSDWDVMGFDEFQWDIPVEDFAYAPLHRLDGEWQVVAAPVRHRLKLASALTPEVTSISVNLWADPQRSDKLRGDFPLSLPDAERGIPGVVWVGAERIEYFSLSVSEDLATLGELRRATKGTSLSEILPVGTPVENGALLISPHVPVGTDAVDRRVAPINVLLAAA